MSPELETNNLCCADTDKHTVHYSKQDTSELYGE
jgi:hypothetical protein